ncbi:PAAR domain-containing protein [Burkholderia ambifaria]|uniref:PAAR domain-containing protein n=2 Tax=Burkholderiaceae TaxID=119060 RepID=UPI003C7A4D23
MPRSSCWRRRTPRRGRRIRRRSAGISDGPDRHVMGQKRYIIEGDVHSHGGRVVSGAPNSRINGRAIARLHDSARSTAAGKAKR